ncbi:hypothetical protein IPJ72_03535 [Candidatus Peregrinibacteria bacterium]|nr:MAG: hypothetical protein IPJ72_03535 [Candidatus Peregrinibacteria bacterium]
MPIVQNIFRAYDIRGVYQKDLNEEAAYLIGRGFASYLLKEKNLVNPTVVVGRDNRTHSQSLQAEFIRGLTESGCRVTNIGLSASPYLYFSTCEGKFDAGCNITASHNPKEYNGFKLLTANAHAVFGDELQKVYQLIVAGDFVNGDGSEEPGDFATAYLKKLQSMFEFKEPLRVVVDTGNGIAAKCTQARLNRSVTMWWNFLPNWMALFPITSLTRLWNRI